MNVKRSRGEKFQKIKNTDLGKPTYPVPRVNSASLTEMDCLRNMALKYQKKYIGKANRVMGNLLQWRWNYDLDFLKHLQAFWTKENILLRFPVTLFQEKWKSKVNASIWTEPMRKTNISPPGLRLLKETECCAFKEQAFTLMWTTVKRLD